MTITKQYHSGDEKMETKPQIIGYKVVVLSGSYGCDVIEFDGCIAREHEVSCDCGHRHRTDEAAEKCRQKLLNWSADGQNCCAKWYNAKVVPIYKDYTYTHLSIE